MGQERRLPAYKRVYLINRDFQIPYVKLAVILGLGSTVLTTVVILFPLFYFNILRSPQFLPIPFLLAMVLAAFMNLLTIAGFAIVVTHRIAGPMFALGRHFRNIMSSDRFGSDLKIRDTDDMQFVVEEFNQVMSHIRALTNLDAERIKELETSINKSDLAAAKSQVKVLKDSFAKRLENVPRIEA